MKRTKISSLLQTDKLGCEVNVKGWVRNRRGSKHVLFVALNDGSTINSIQIVAESENFDASLIWAPTMGRFFYLGFRYKFKK